MTSFNLNALCKDAISKFSHMLRGWGLGFQHMHWTEARGRGGHCVNTAPDTEWGHSPPGEDEPVSRPEIKTMPWNLPQRSLRGYPCCVGGHRDPGISACSLCKPHCDLASWALF